MSYIIYFSLNSSIDIMSIQEVNPPLNEEVIKKICRLHYHWRYVRDELDFFDDVPASQISPLFTFTMNEEYMRLTLKEFYFNSGRTNPNAPLIWLLLKGNYWYGLVCLPQTESKPATAFYACPSNAKGRDEFRSLERFTFRNRQVDIFPLFIDVGITSELSSLACTESISRILSMDEIDGFHRDNMSASIRVEESQLSTLKEILYGDVLKHESFEEGHADYIFHEPALHTVISRRIQELMTSYTSNKSMRIFNNVLEACLNDKHFSYQLVIFKNIWNIVRDEMDSLPGTQGKINLVFDHLLKMIERTLDPSNPKGQCKGLVVHPRFLDLLIRKAALFLGRSTKITYMLQLQKFYITGEYSDVLKEGQQHGWEGVLSHLRNYFPEGTLTHPQTSRDLICQIRYAYALGMIVQRAGHLQDSHHRFFNAISHGRNFQHLASSTLGVSANLDFVIAMVKTLKSLSSIRRKLGDQFHFTILEDALELEHENAVKLNLHISYRRFIEAVKAPSVNYITVNGMLGKLELQMKNLSTTYFEGISGYIIMFSSKLINNGTYEDTIGLLDRGINLLEKKRADITVKERSTLNDSLYQLIRHKHLIELHVRRNELEQMPVKLQFISNVHSKHLVEEACDEFLNTILHSVKAIDSVNESAETEEIARSMKDAAQAIKSIICKPPYANDLKFKEPLTDIYDVLSDIALKVGELNEFITYSFCSHFLRIGEQKPEKSNGRVFAYLVAHIRQRTHKASEELRNLGELLYHSWLPLEIGVQGTPNTDIAGRTLKTYALAVLFRNRPVGDYIFCYEKWEKLLARDEIETLLVDFKGDHFEKTVNGELFFYKDDIE